MKQHHVKPRAGILVPLPDGNGYLPADGQAVVLGTYWYQRQADGDLTISELPVPALVEPDAAPADKASAATKSKGK